MRNILTNQAFDRKKQLVFRVLLFAIPLFSLFTANAQQITGVWKGKINKKKVEVKIIQKGDSLTGTSYYYESKNNYSRYSIKGYFDPNTNSAIWWDDQLIEERKGNGLFGAPGKAALLSVADFNCPGGGQMTLDGKASSKENRDEVKGPVNLEKTGTSSFEDEWDFIIDNYTVGGNDPYLIDSVGSIASISHQQKQKTITEQDKNEIISSPRGEKQKPVEIIQKNEVAIQSPVSSRQENKIVTIKQPTIEEKFISRKKIFTTEIPIEGDSVELRFYDNAEVDGDSISLFLNGRLLFQHIRLTEKSYTIKIPVTDLGNNNELIMVAENLGSIPPNTSYMVCMVGEKRYEANLASTEESSAMIRLVRKNMKY